MRLFLIVTILLSNCVSMQVAYAQSWGQLKSAAIDAQNQKKYSEASDFWNQALSSCEDKTGARYIQSLDGLARCYADQDKFENAESQYKIILAIIKPENLSDDSKTAMISYAALLRKMKREADAIELETKFSLAEKPAPIVTTKQEPVQAFANPKAEQAKLLSNWNALIAASTKELGAKHYPQAEQNLKQALELSSKIGDTTASDTLNRLVLLYYAQDKFQLAEPRYLRSLQITAKMSGTESKAYANALNGHGQLLRKLNRKTEAMAEEAKADAILARVNSKNASGALSSSARSGQSSDPSGTRSGSLLNRAKSAQGGFNRDSNSALDEN